MSEEKREILEFIDAYQSLPALWDVTSPEYNDRNLKDQQYGILLQFYKKRHPRGNLQDLKKRINVLRTNFRRELRRQDNLEKNGAGPFDTTLYYFDAISFLGAAVSKVKREDGPKRIKQDLHKRSKKIRSVSPKSTSSNFEGIKEMATKAIADLAERKKDKDQFDAFGTHVAAELRSLTSAKATYAKRKLARALVDIMDEVEDMEETYIYGN